jgi:hypothetical protein
VTPGTFHLQSAVARAVVVLVLERAFVVGGEVVAAITRVLAGRGRDLGQISVATTHTPTHTDTRYLKGTLAKRYNTLPDKVP